MIAHFCKYLTRMYVGVDSLCYPICEVDGLPSRLLRLFAPSKLLAFPNPIPVQLFPYPMHSPVVTLLPKSLPKNANSFSFSLFLQLFLELVLDLLCV